MAEERKETNRTAKERTARHDLTYFQHLRGMKAWRFWLSLALIAGASVLLFAQHVRNKESFYAGRLSRGHSLLANRCEACHVNILDNGKRARSIFFQKATDKACLTCHNAPAHHEGETASKLNECSTCHVEHQGHVSLIAVRDQRCIDCHSDLPHQKPGTKFASSITGFDAAIHRDFQAAVDQTPLPIIFLHSKHLGKALDVSGRFATCNDCHRPVAAQGLEDWRFKGEGFQAKAFSLDGQQRVHPDFHREFMSMPSYESSCEPCHRLKFDFDDCSESLRHPLSKDDVFNLPQQLEGKLAAYIARHPEKINPASAAKSSISVSDSACKAVPGEDQFFIPEAGRSAPPKSSEEWVKRRMQKDEKILWENTCSYCHLPNSPVSKEHWLDVAQNHYSEFKALRAPRMPHSVFSHEAHIGVTCESCHRYPDINNACASASNPKECLAFYDGEAPKYRESLLTSITICQQCHRASPASAGKAENGCFLCHQYHKWMPEKEKLDGQYTIQQLTGAAPIGSDHPEKPQNGK